MSKLRHSDKKNFEFSLRGAWAGEDKVFKPYDRVNGIIEKTYQKGPSGTNEKPSLDCTNGTNEKP